MKQTLYITNGDKSMNYLKEVIAFNDLVELQQLSTGQIALWHALMSINNKCHWVEWFTVTNLRLQLSSGLSRQGINKNRNVLKQLGLIDFRPNGTRATYYKMNSISVNYVNDTLKSVQDSVQVSSQDSVQVSSQVGSTLYKQNKTKLNKIIYYYENNIDINVTQTILDKLSDYLDMDVELVNYAIDLAVENNSRRFNYIDAILRNWKNKGFIKKSQAIAEIENYRKAKNKKSNEREYNEKEFDLLYTNLQGE